MFLYPWNLQNFGLQSNFRGDLLVSLMYNPTTHEFKGIIHKATGLKKCDMFGLSGIKLIAVCYRMIVYIVHVLN